MKSVTVRSAYGRQYESAADVLADWHAGKDFRIVGGPYVNKRDAMKYGVMEVRFRFKNDTQVVTWEGVA